MDHAYPRAAEGRRLEGVAQYLGRVAMEVHADQHLAAALPRLPPYDDHRRGDVPGDAEAGRAQRHAREAAQAAVADDDLIGPAALGA